jgi:protein-S-isoprenylcysteine O-methyltransferase Ste14
MNTIESLQQIFLVGLFGWNFILFSIALRRNFSCPSGVPPMMRALAGCGLLATLTDIVVLLTSQLMPVRSLIGIGLLILSQLLFRAAVNATSEYKLSLAFSSDMPSSLNKSGPYRYIRHPFYTAYSLTWFAVVVASAHIAAVGALLVMAAFYFTAAWREERKFLRSPLADAYRDYQRFTGMFFPHPNIHQC